VAREYSSATRRSESTFIDNTQSFLEPEFIQSEPWAPRKGEIAGAWILYLLQPNEHLVYDNILVACIESREGCEWMIVPSAEAFDNNNSIDKTIIIINLFALICNSII